MGSFSAVSLKGSTREEVQWDDVGAPNAQRSDYPVFAKKVVSAILEDESEFGILICGSGVGMGITANRFKGIYAGLCFTPEMATVARSDDNINVLVLASDFLEHQQAVDIVAAVIQAWGAQTFKGGRYQERLDMIDE